MRRYDEDVIVAWWQAAAWAGEVVEVAQEEAAEEEDRRPWLRMPTRATRVGAMGIAAWGDCEVEITTGGSLGRS